MPTLTNPELEARLLADPTDTQTYLVYADWLSQRGDPRGELITLQHAQQERRPARRAVAGSGRDQEDERGGGDPELAAAIERLLWEHGQEWVGPAAAQPKQAVLEWELGHVRAVRFKYDDYGAYSEQGALLKELVSRPAGRLLRRIDHELFAGDQSAAGIIEALAETRPPALRELSLCDYEACCLSDLNGISWLECGDVSPLYAALPRLEELTLMGVVELGARVELPALRRFALRTGTLTRASLAAIVAADWPELEELELWFGDSNYGAECEAGDVAPLLDGARLPKLRSLGLRNAELADELCALLPQSKLLPRLRALDLSMGTLGSRGARALAEHAAAFRHLERLDVSQSYLGEADLARLAAFGPALVATEQRVADEDDDEVRRYVVVGE